ncbi:MAG: catalase [Clostridia bacterium]
MKDLTDELGNKISSDNFSLSTGIPGQTLLEDNYLLGKLAHFNRERIPERVVHAKGGGAFGYFEVTNDLSKYTCANFLSNVGKKTEILARFSTVGGERGSSDSVRDPRGFALKFYTQDGIYDLVGNNTPVFFIRDAIKFPDFIHTQKRDPKTNLKNPNMFWDFLSLTPESIHQVMILFSDRGIPKSFRHMHGFGSNTYMWYNQSGEYFFVKYHIKTNQKIENLDARTAEVLSGNDPDSAVRDLYESIQRGKYPSWKFYVQIMTKDEAKKYKFDPFDVTKVWYHKDFPLISLGNMVLNKNPDNFFTDVEQAAFSPSHFVKGIDASPDKLLQGRLMAYPDAHRYRIGTNANELEINKSKSDIYTYQKDGQMASTAQGNTKLNYFPNTYENIQTNKSYKIPDIKVDGFIARHEYPLKDIDFEQPGQLYRRVMSDMQKSILVTNLTNSLKLADKKLQYRTVALFYKTDTNLGQRLSNNLSLNLSNVEKLASMSQEQRVKNTLNDIKN